MTSLLSLNEYLQQYRQGSLTRKEFEALIFKFFHDDYRNFPSHCTKEERIDFLCWFYPALTRAIDTYSDTGSSFQSYLKSIIYWNIRDYKRQQIQEALDEYSCWVMCAEDITAQYDTADCLALERKINLPLKHCRNQRQILFLLLKSYCFVSDDFLSRIAPTLDMTVQDLSCLIAQVKQVREKQEQRIQSYEEKVHTQFYRCISFEKRLKIVSPELASYKRIKVRAQRAWIRFKKMREELKKMNRGASNREVAQALGIPKGTVDSNLYALKHGKNVAVLKKQEEP
ncbi:MAG: hypothetical protein LBO67_02825 [Spirochaetaceae bacterium]|jgi:hypothetical protein|nr:hypothetical protein [Spirochaetaceae bacterium]